MPWRINTTTMYCALTFKNTLHLTKISDETVNHVTFTKLNKLLKKISICIVCSRGWLSHIFNYCGIHHYFDSITNETTLF